MDFQRAAGRCEAAGRFPQLASEFSPEARKGVSREERFIPLSILSAQVILVSVLILDNGSIAFIVYCFLPWLYRSVYLLYIYVGKCY